MIASGNPFIAYLWGIETSHICMPFFEPECLSRTYEELKHRHNNRCLWISWKFIAYLWGIETSNSNFDHFVALLVYRVPMRNWNLRVCPFGFFQPWRLSRTYEELKLSIKDNSSIIWTCLSRTYEELKQASRIFQKAKKWHVYRVPMRNWNV